MLREAPDGAIILIEDIDASGGSHGLDIEDDDDARRFNRALPHLSLLHR